MVEQIPERAQATAIQRLHTAAQDRERVRQHEREATSAMRVAVRSALRAGVSTRRIRQVTGLSLDTIGRWSRSD